MRATDRRQSAAVRRAGEFGEGRDVGDDDRDRLVMAEGRFKLNMARQ
jgi:hypothetical protein